MNETKRHTPEPWSLDAGIEPAAFPKIANALSVAHVRLDGSVRTVCALLPYIADDTPDALTEETEANWKRIVECVNACEGIEDPERAIGMMRETLESIATGNCASDVSAEALYALMVSLGFED